MCNKKTSGLAYLGRNRPLCLSPLKYEDNEVKQSTVHYDRHHSDPCTSNIFSFAQPLLDEKEVGLKAIMVRSH